MSKTVVVIDYKIGNISSVLKMLSKLGANCKLSSEVEEIEKASHLILPGVGHFAVGMENLHRLNLVDIVKAQAKTKPFLGICLGMQLLFNSSEEALGVNGLGLINGEVKKFDISLKVPHIGWNDVFGDNKPDILAGIEDKANFYFVHSYYAKLNEKIQHTVTDYEFNFVSSVGKEKVFGTQFHPEKSQKNGEKLLKNFLEVN